MKKSNFFMIIYFEKQYHFWYNAKNPIGARLLLPAYLFVNDVRKKMEV